MSFTPRGNSGKKPGGPAIAPPKSRPQPQPIPTGNPGTRKKAPGAPTPGGPAPTGNKGTFNIPKIG